MNKFIILLCICYFGACKASNFDLFQDLNSKPASMLDIKLTKLELELNNFSTTIMNAPELHDLMVQEAFSDGTRWYSGIYNVRIENINNVLKYKVFINPSFEKTLSVSNFYNITEFLSIITKKYLGESFNIDEALIEIIPKFA